MIQEDYLLDPDKIQTFEKALDDPYSCVASLGDLSLFEFFQVFWSEVSDDKLRVNWHIPYLCDILENAAQRVGDFLPKEQDIIINIPPGTTKTLLVSVVFPVWCWTRWYWMKFITGSYSDALALESAEKSRDIMRSDKFRTLYPDITIKEDKDTKSNYRIAKILRNERGRAIKTVFGGGRYSTSVGGTITGFHGHINIWDDPINPKQAASEPQLLTANNWVDQSASTRKADKAVTMTIMVMQRLAMDDPTGHTLAKPDKKIQHICLPGEIRNYKAYLNPPELEEFYTDDLLDPIRLSWDTLKEMEADLGQYGFAGQVGQHPVPPGGGMFKVEHFQILQQLPSEVHQMQTLRYWDKAGSMNTGCFTVGVKMMKLKNNQIVILDVKRGQWAAEKREQIIKETAIADGSKVHVWIEQEPGPIWEDELVQMYSGLCKPLKDVKVGEYVINNCGNPTKVLKVHKQGLQNILKITTDSGRIIHAAFNHPFYTPDGWIDAGNLQIGDVLALRTQKKHKITSFPTIEECRLAGYFVGDGCCTLSKNGSPNANIVCSDPTEGADIIYCAEKLGFKVHVGGSKGWTYYLSGGSRDWLKSAGLAGKNTFQKRIPEWVLSASDECVANFLGAYLACDGSVMNTKDHPCVEYYSTNLPLLRDAQTALLRFGIYTMLRKRNYKESFQSTRHTCYRITTRRSDGSMGRFAKYIPVYGVKGEKLKVFKHFTFNQAYLPDPITAIEEIPPLPCRCITVEHGESFIVNDFVVHNSGGLESAQATIRNLSGFMVFKDKPNGQDGDKIRRADPYSVQVNNGNILLLQGLWNKEFIEEHRFFPFGKYKDQVDASAAGFNQLHKRKIAGRYI